MPVGTLLLTDRCGPFRSADLNSLSAVECRRISPFATGVAVRIGSTGASNHEWGDLSAAPLVDTVRDSANDLIERMGDTACADRIVVDDVERDGRTVRASDVAVECVVKHQVVLVEAFSKPGLYVAGI